MVTRSLAGLVMAASIAFAGLAEKPAAAAQAPPQPLVQVVSIVVDSVDLLEGVAVATVTLDVVGETVTQVVNIPLGLDGLEDEDGVCAILSLELGPIDLDLLGLVVYLHDCEDGAVTIDIDALAGEGLLGDLLCGLAGGLLGGVDLGDLLGLLTPEDLDELTGAIQDVLNEFFAELLSPQGNRPPHAGQQGPPAHAGQQGPPPHANRPPFAGGPHNGNGNGEEGRCDILILEIENGISLELLGLLVETSGVCLEVYAEEGEGNLLGNLLCDVTNLLNTSGGGLGRQLRALIDQIVGVLEGL